MPLFAVLFGGMMAQLVTFLAMYFTRKVAVIAAGVAAYGVIAGVLLVGFNAAMVPLVSAAFNTAYGQFLGLAFPPVAGTCMATLAGTWAACVLYAWQLKALSIAVQA